MSESRRQRIESILTSALGPQWLEVIDESHKHSRGKDESHLKLIVVSQEFAGHSRIERQRHIYALLAAELKSGLHALSLATYTPEEWQQREQKVVESPPCASGQSPVTKTKT